MQPSEALVLMFANFDPVLVLANIMVWALQFELAFTPKDAKHYAQLKTDLMRWEGVQFVHQIRSDR